MQQRYKDLLDAIELERASEEAHYLRLSANKTVQEKIAAGILWYPLKPISEHYSIGELIELTYERTKHLDTPHKLKAGIGCILFKMEGTKRTAELRANISRIRRDKISIILSAEVVSKNDLSEFSGHLGIELIHDERPYKVMKKTILSLDKLERGPLQQLRDGIAEQDAFDEVDALGYEVTPDYLNHSQIAALNGCLAARYMSIIHGPPGTGKTTTLISVIRSLLKNEKRVLVCAPSNNAVDLLAQHLDAAGVNVIRVGNVTRIGDDLGHLTLIEKARAHPDWQHIKKVKIEADSMRKQAAKHKRRFGEQERKDRRHGYRQARELLFWARDLEDKLVDSLLREAQVICSTLIGVSHKTLASLRFRTLVIDEASQALEPECWTAMLRAERVILAGDHLQLSPTVKSPDATMLGLGETLLTRMTDKITHTYLLDTQYRMHDKILSFSNERFYEGRLHSDPANADRMLDGDDSPLCYIDTSGCGFDEIQNEKTLSRKNEGEYFILREHFVQHAERYEGATIGIISPYSEQVKHIRGMIEEDALMKTHLIRVDSIDGFQGQERDVIYISLVRSNPDGEIGFLADERRLNVAMTRARKKLVMIGDMSTLGSSKLFSALADHVEKEGLYSSAWEYMSYE